MCIRDSSKEGSPQKRKHPIEEIVNTEYFQTMVALHNAKTRTVFTFPMKDLETRFGSLKTQRFLWRFSASFGSINAGFETASDYNQLNEMPILSISDTEFLIPAPILLSSVPVRTLHYDLIRIPGYGPTYERLRGEYYETTTSANLSRVFGSKHVFKNLKFGGKNSKGEIDVLVIFDNKLIIVQCKSKGLTLPAKQGSSDSILHDFSKAIQASYDQSQRARDYFLSNSVVTLTDLKGTSMKIAKADIRDIFLISVTSETFASLSTDLSLLLKRRHSVPFPWVASIFDLELVCEYIPDPYQFIHFLRRRQLAHGQIESPDEMEYVGCYLQQGLWFDRVLTGKFSKVVIDGYTRDFDIDQFRKQYGITTSTRIGSSWSNPSFSNLLGTLRILGDKGHSDMILTLLDLGSVDRDKLIKLIGDTVAKTASDRTHHDFTLLYDNFGLSFVANYGRMGLRDINIGMSVTKKYRHRKQMWLGLGRDVTDARYLVNEFCFIDEPWAFDARMQRLASRLKGERIKLKKRQDKLK